MYQQHLPPQQQWQQQQQMPQQYPQQQQVQQPPPQPAGAQPLEAPAGAVGSPYGNAPALGFKDIPVNAQLYGTITKLTFSDNTFKGDYKGRQAVVSLRIDHAPNAPQFAGQEYAIFLTGARYRDFLACRVGVGDKWGFNYLGKVDTKSGNATHKLGQFAEKVTPEEAPTDPFPYGSQNQDAPQNTAPAAATPIYQQQQAPVQQAPATGVPTGPQQQPATGQYPMNGHTGQQPPTGQPPIGSPPPVQQPPVGVPPTSNPAPGPHTAGYMQVQGQQVQQPQQQQQQQPPPQQAPMQQPQNNNIPNFFSQGGQQ